MFVNGKFVIFKDGPFKLLEEMKYWERKEKLFKYVDGVRQFFPHAKEQLDTISRIIEKFNPSINTFLDLGCGDGYLGYFISSLYPDAHGVFLDLSKEMINKARKKDAGDKFEFFIQDMLRQRIRHVIVRLKS